MSLLVGFSGQGGQHRGMFKLLTTNKQGKDWLRDASKLANLDLFDELAVEKACADVIEVQGLLMILNLGVFYILERQSSLSPAFLCGYSLGELCAFCASINLDLVESFALVRKRALLMQEALAKQDTGLAVLKGRINQALVKDLCEKYNCYLAIVNAEDHYIVGGMQTALDQLILAAKGYSILKAEKLAVNMASHTPLLAQASEAFAAYLQNFQSYSMRYPILNALTQERIFNTRTMLFILAKELSQTLYWDKVMVIAQEYGVHSFLELGPKAALKNMMYSAEPEIKAYHLEGFSSLDGLLHFVKKLF